MKQSTRHHVQRVAAGILASLLTLSGIGAAHATNPGATGEQITQISDGDAQRWDNYGNRSVGLHTQWRTVIPQTVLTPAHKTERSVRFHSNDKRDMVVTVHATDGDTVSLKTGLTRDGYVLAGWATTPGSSTLAYPATGRLTVDGDSDLYAVWELAGTGSQPALEQGKTAPQQEKPHAAPHVVSETHTGEQLASTGSMVSSVALLAMVLVTVGLSTVLLVRRRQ